MPSVFNHKNFNAEVFGKYLETVPRVKQNAFIKAGILRARPDLKTMLMEQTGGNFISVPMSGLIGGEALNYDGNTNITAETLETFIQSMVVVGRAKAWEEKDFSQDITGKDFMEVIAAQVSNYWDDVDQSTILSILKGVFGVTANNFAANHTLDITGATVKTVGVTSLNDAIQKASGANKNIFTLAIMHSQVATNLENLNLLEYLKYTDEQGVQRNLALADWNGRTVMIDDDVPTEEVVSTQGVYTFNIDTAATAGDKIVIFDTEYEFVANSATPVGNQIKVGASGTAAQQATNIVAALSAKTTGPETKYTFAVDSSTKVKATQKTTAYGYHAPVAVGHAGASGTLVVGAVTEVTASVENVKYTTYLLGRDAFDYCDCGAKVPSEMWRDPKSAGGKDWLITRQRKLFAPKGFSFVMPTPAVMSPTKENLESNACWAPVADTAGTGYFNSKAVPLARIVSFG